MPSKSPGLLMEKGFSSAENRLCGRGLAGIPSRIVHFLKRTGLPLHYIRTRDLAQDLAKRRGAERQHSLSAIALNKTSMTRPPGQYKLCCVDGLFIRRVS